MRPHLGYGFRPVCLTLWHKYQQFGASPRIGQCTAGNWLSSSPLRMPSRHFRGDWMQIRIDLFSSPRGYLTKHYMIPTVTGVKNLLSQRELVQPYSRSCRFTFCRLIIGYHLLIWRIITNVCAYLSYRADGVIRKYTHFLPSLRVEVSKKTLCGTNKRNALSPCHLYRFLTWAYSLMYRSRDSTCWH